MGIEIDAERAKEAKMAVEEAGECLYYVLR